MELGKIIIFLIGLFLTFGSAHPDSDSPGSKVVVGSAIVDSVQVDIADSDPNLVVARVEGYLPDGCTILGDTTVERDGNNFVVTIETLRPEDAMCTQALVPYEEIITLAEGLEAGEYTVDVNGVSTNFSV